MLQCGMDIIDLDAHRPHIVVTVDDTVYIVPRALIDDIARGRSSIAEAESPEVMARVIAKIAADYIDEFDRRQ